MCFNRDWTYLHNRYGKSHTDESRAADVIKNWSRTRTTLEFLGTWEKIYNPDFKVVEFDHFKTQAGLPSFVLSPTQWVEKTNAIGIFSKTGRYGGTYAHKDIAFEDWVPSEKPKIDLWMMRPQDLKVSLKEYFGRKMYFQKLISCLRASNRLFKFRINKKLSKKPGFFARKFIIRTRFIHRHLHDTHISCLNNPLYFDFLLTNGIPSW